MSPQNTASTANKKMLFLISIWAMSTNAHYPEHNPQFLFTFHSTLDAWTSSSVSGRTTASGKRSICLVRSRQISAKPCPVPARRRDSESTSTRPQGQAITLSSTRKKSINSSFWCVIRMLDVRNRELDGIRMKLILLCYRFRSDLYRTKTWSTMTIAIQFVIIHIDSAFKARTRYSSSEWFFQAMGRSWEVRNWTLWQHVPHVQGHT